MRWALIFMHDLALIEINVALVVLPGQGQQAAFAAHFEGLHQIDHVHLARLPAQHAVKRRRLGHLFQCNFVDHALDPPSGFFQKERLLEQNASTGSCCERRSLMSVLVARMMAAKLAVAGRLRSFSMSCRPSMPGMR